MVRLLQVERRNGWLEYSDRLLEKAQEISIKTFPCKPSIVGLVTCVLIYCIWDKSRGPPSTEVNSLLLPPSLPAARRMLYLKKKLWNN